MKKLALLLFSLVTVQVADAQFYLSGTSYTQNFDNIANGLPTGWSVRTAASATALGNDVSSTNFVATPGTTTVWSSSTGNFRNAASANGFANYAAGTAALQGTATDRALAVRQVGNTSSTFPGTDSGAAFVFQIANTTGLTNLNLTFKLQTLDSTSARVTTWKVDYATGATPTTFTPATATGTVTTGGNTYSNNSVSVNFGAALNNQAGPVWIRIVTLLNTTGSGNRTTTGIDDFNLTWTGTAQGTLKPSIVSFTPANGTTNVPAATNLTITFNRGIHAGTTGNIYVTNETSHATQTIAASSSNVTTSGNTATISGVTLVNASTYHVTFDSVAFDTAGFKSFGLYDTAAWVFSTIPNVTTVTALDENFDAACANSALPAGWSKYSVTGPGQQWRCITPTSGTNLTATNEINGYQSGVNYANEDWLITPKLNLTAYPYATFQFDMWKRFSGDELTVRVSSNYIGYGDPNAASWTTLNLSFAAADTVTWKTFTANLNPYLAQPFFVAFRYTSGTTSAYQLRVDNVKVTATSSVASYNKASLDMAVVGTATRNNIALAYTLKEAGIYKLSVMDITGREVYSNEINGVAGAQRFSINNIDLNSGMYIIRISNANSFGVVKASVQ